MTHRNPFDAHLCAQDPAAFAGGFSFARFWVDHLAHPGEAEAIYRAVRDSSGVPFIVTGSGVGLPITPEGEGFALGVYGLMRNEETP